MFRRCFERHTGRCAVELLRSRLDGSEEARLHEVHQEARDADVVLLQHHQVPLPVYIAVFHADMRRADADVLQELTVEWSYVARKEACPVTTTTGERASRGSWCAGSACR
jgi:hypothetical protein